MVLNKNHNKVKYKKYSFLYNIFLILIITLFFSFLIYISIFELIPVVLTTSAKVVLFTFSLFFITLIAFYALRKLTEPIMKASVVLDKLVTGRNTQRLPVHYGGEIGLLLRNINHIIKKNNKDFEEKLNLISLLTHDLRQYAGNPMSLTQILLKDHTLTKKSVEIVNLINSNAEKQLSFIDAFIELLKIENQISEAKNNIISVNINDLKLLLLEDFNFKLVNKKIKLIFNYTNDNSIITIAFEDVLFYRILSNLIDNAIKFSLEGSTIIVDIKNCDDKYLISVIDDGIGFKPEISGDLFNKFTVYGRLGTHNEKSTGIGLYLCRSIAEKFNAKIVGISTGDYKGAKFILSITKHE